MKLNIRKINAFLKQKGIEPHEFWEQQAGKRIKIKPKHVKRLENILAKGHQVLVHVKGGKVTLRDVNRKYGFNDPELRGIAEKAKKGVYDGDNQRGV